MSRRMHKEDRALLGKNRDAALVQQPDHPRISPEAHRAKKIRRSVGRPLLYDLWGYVFSLDREGLETITRDFFVLRHSRQLAEVDPRTEILIDKLYNLAEGLYRTDTAIEQAPDVFSPELREAVDTVKRIYHADLDYLKRNDTGEGEEEDG